MKECRERESFYEKEDMIEEESDKSVQETDHLYDDEEDENDDKDPFQNKIKKFYNHQVPSSKGNLNI